MILAQREKDLQAFYQQREHVDTLIKMMGKVSENITGEKLNVSAIECNKILYRCKVTEMQ